MNQQIASAEEAKHTVELQISRDGSGSFLDNTSGVKYPADSKSSWKVKVKPPPALKGSNMQYVIEAVSIFNDGSNPSEEDFMFTYPKMCDGRRSFGRNYDEAVSLELNGKADSIELWAGWATGFGVVSITPRLLLFKGKPETEEEL